MAKLILLCGKICSGKTFYANIIKKKENAFIFSCDEITLQLFNNKLGGAHDNITEKIKKYIYKKSEELIALNVNVILDFGFWTKEERTKITNILAAKNICYEWHYIFVSDDIWIKRIKKRNKLIEKGLSSDFYVDDRLLNKINSLFEYPINEEMKVYYNND